MEHGKASLAGIPPKMLQQILRVLDARELGKS